MPFPRSEPLSPVLMSTPSRRARSRSPRVYSSTEPRASTHLSRSPSPAPEMPPLPEMLANFPETPSTLPQSAQFAALIDRQATVFASDEVFFHNHFSQAEADRDNAEQQRTTFFVAAEGERDRWFRALEEQREARSADAEFARRGGEEARSRAFEDHNSRRHWRCQTAQFRIEREYESAKSAHVDALCTRQNRMVRLIEVHKHVITALRTRIAVLRTGVQTPHERPHVRRVTSTASVLCADHRLLSTATLCTKSGQGVQTLTPRLRMRPLRLRHRRLRLRLRLSAFRQVNQRCPNRGLPHRRHRIAAHGSTPARRRLHGPATGTAVRAGTVLSIYTMPSSSCRPRFSKSPPSASRYRLSRTPRM
ncbi:hypothetical protein EXIGLDRAFT_251223 [Exidia glandulosa HHB12029]|uniref:Uncharacterized protein n=1 Tax=Exidia glandulosa HHB12029 TaxID=1314781 RepID=A0A165MHX1_EXIGL|nr:hypothetical protein EXIGLDRAFT_251223 [Exidia glandulosa HHB12029]